MPNRGEIWLADLNPPHGTEPGKTRPVLIVQAQALLDAAHPSTLIVPLTTNLVSDAEPLRVRVPAAGAPPAGLRHSWIRCEQSTTAGWCRALSPYSQPIRR